MEVLLGHTRERLLLISMLVKLVRRSSTCRVALVVDEFPDGLLHEIDDLVFPSRSVVVERAMAKVHFADSAGQPTLLSAVDGPCHHVFCATDLRSGDHVYLTPRLVYSYRVGKGVSGALTLATAV